MFMFITFLLFDFLDFVLLERFKNPHIYTQKKLKFGLSMMNFTTKSGDTCILLRNGVST
jgi:hypothetical protein